MQWLKPFMGTESTKMLTTLNRFPRVERMLTLIYELNQNMPIGLFPAMLMAL